MRTSAKLQIPNQLFLLCLLLFSACYSNPEQKTVKKSGTPLSCSLKMKGQESLIIEKYHNFQSDHDSSGVVNTLEKIRVFANQGCATSEYEMGLYSIGENNVEAVSYLTAAAQSGDLASQFKLYQLFDDGVMADDSGVQIEKDSIKAKGYFTGLIQRKYPPALVELAKRKLVETVLLYRDAADSGNLEALDFMARAYRYGTGVEDELDAKFRNAYVYYSVAAMISAPSGQCQDFLASAREYESRLTKLEIGRWRQMVVQWFDNHPKLKSNLKEGGKCP